MSQFSERVLRGLARRDPRDRAKKPLLLATALLKRATGRPEIASRYLTYLGLNSPPNTPSAESRFDDAGYYETLEDENYATYLNSNARLIEHVASNKAVSICDIGCGRGQLLNELENLGLRNCVGYEISKEATAHSVHPRVSLIESLADIQGTFNIVSLISVLEHIPVDHLDEFLEGVRGLAGDYVVACMPTYPENMLDFFDNDPTHLNLERREWWDSIMAQHGFRPEGLPSEPLPYIQPFIYRTVSLPLKSSS